MRLFAASSRTVPQGTDPFDVPDRGTYLGMRSDGSRLVCVLTLAPGPPSPVSLPDGPRTLVPIHEIASCMAWTDIHPTRVDVVTRTLTCWGDGPAARAYRGLLGPLSPASHRTVALVVHIDPAEHPTAVALRGGGSLGTLRAALWCVRRVIAACGLAGVRARALTASELSSDGAWTVADDAPVAARIRLGRVDGSAPPLSGDGQLIGANDAGAPVAFRLAGPSIPRVDIAADMRTVRQTVVRSLALGVRTHIVSDRPDEWLPLIGMIDDPVLLSHGWTAPPTAQLVVDDTDETVPEEPGLTVLDVLRADRAPSSDGHLFRQDLDDPSAVHVIAPGGTHRTTVRTVTTPAERELTG